MLTENEKWRQEVLKKYAILDTPPEETFDRITRLAANLLSVPIALISLVDEKRQWFKSRVGLDATETPREHAFCAHAILQREPLIINDALSDARFWDNPLVTGELAIRFYAGAPLITAHGVTLGTVCCIDRQPREISDHQMLLLQDLAAITVELLEKRLLQRSV